MARERSARARSAGAALLALMIVAICGGLVAVLRRSGLETTASWAQLASVPLAVAPLVPLVVGGWRRHGTAVSTPEQVDRAQETLAGLVAEQWRAEILARRLDDPAPLAVRWRLTGLPVMDRAAAGGRRFLSAGPRLTVRSDRVDDLVRAFRDLPRRRLVVLGDPGMGKTTLAVLLLRGLLGDRRPGDPVPVLVTLAGWAPDAVPFDAWFASRLAAMYPALRADAFGPDAPAALVRRRRVLPVLDGLDEVPEPLRAPMITALNAALTAADGLVLTCRTAEYAAAVAAPGGDVLTAGAVIEPRPLRPADTAAYVARSLPPHPPGAWRDLVAVLASGERTPAAEALATPLALWLLRKVYADTRTDPAVLLNRTYFRTPAAITGHLLDHLVPSLAGRNRAWTSGRASAWLAYLARHLTATGTTDLAWWNLRLRHRTLVTSSLVGVLAGLTLTLTNAVLYGFTSKLGNGLSYGLGFAALCGFFGWASARPARSPLRKAALWLGGGLVFGLASGLGDAVTDGLADGLTDGLTIGLADGLCVGLAYGLATGFRAPAAAPAHAEFRLRGRTRALLHHLAICLTVGLLFGPAAGLVKVLAGEAGHELAYGLSAGLAVSVHSASTLGIVFGLTFGPALAVRNWARTPQPTGGPQTPRDSLRRDLRLACLESAALGLATGLAFGLSTGLVAGPVNGVSYGLLFGLAFAAMIALRSPGVTYLVTLLFLRRRVPFRLMRFLDEAHELGVLRRAGAVHQFRHADLQERLADVRPAAGAARRIAV
ncbi:NACHT domain-containing protein [Actinomadura rubteroloni]|nr:NACHT domain-containing protein [Actinomadura rubteroloni]